MAENIKKKKKYATISWTVFDILSIQDDWTEKQAEEWLENNQKYIVDKTIECGWNAIEALIEYDSIQNK